MLNKDTLHEQLTDLIDLLEDVEAVSEIREAAERLRYEIDGLGYKLEAENLRKIADFLDPQPQPSTATPKARKVAKAKIKGG